MQLSKLATPTVQLFNKKLLAQRMGAIVLAQAQKRNVQSEYKPGKAISFIDMMSGAYDDPKTTIDLKPLEWRDEQASSWTSLGAVTVLVPNFGAFFLAAFCLAWYSLYDDQSSFWRSDPHPVFRTKDGSDLWHSLNPVFGWSWPYAPIEKDVRNFFYGEIEQALQKKN